ncbi:selenium-binding protein 3 isoform X2 [Arabidopsis lyrata subsp. lyrata]|uniref:selenium-binding protein 3 isoform X2 n=1 Tax=Arabidopsis lyrata subsp. lyrata TaxID=81972 RepID=UPI000A29A4C2|nr:selenium-binding protein 3 isoform X2 [Arabidopsis lyrata subsp. lyrata]|eukprot:XP_020887373.1 selenium-binding protein 3 isoform X2 [Arabidopsis lyrata subsp. lyrata]
MPYLGIKRHHSAWKSCSSCYGDTSCVKTLSSSCPLSCLVRDKQPLFVFYSGRIYVIDKKPNSREPSTREVVDNAEVLEKMGLPLPASTPAHCLASEDILVSCRGDEDGNARVSDFLLLDSEFNIKGRLLNVEIAKSLPQKPSSSSLPMSLQQLELQRDK